MNTLKKNILRSWIDQGIEIARHLQSQDTNYLHFRPCNHKGWQASPLCPFLENSLFALLLLRSKVKSNMEEGMTLLDNLLHFQNTLENDDKGNFPLSLSHYPSCQDQIQAFDILRVFYEILSDFHLVLDKKLKEKLINSCKSALFYLESWLKKYRESISPFQIFKAYCISEAFYKLLKHPKFIENIFEEEVINCFKSRKNPSHLAQWFIYLQLIDSDLSSTIASLLLEIALSNYSSEQALYYGPSHYEPYQKNTPRSTLLSYYASLISQTPLPKKFPHNLEDLLNCSLIHIPKTRPLDNFSYQEQNSISWKTETCFGSLFQQENLAINNLHKFSHPFRCFIPLKKEEITSLTCQANQATIKSEVVNDNHYKLTFKLPACEEEKDIHKQLITFGISKNKETEVLVAKKRCSYFPLDDTVTIQNKESSTKITISHLEGDSKFSGHIHPGNRSSQITQQTSSELDIFDWLICVTPVYKEGIDTIEVNIKIT
jgi:hypothetical protein